MTKSVVPTERIDRGIVILRGTKVLLDVQIAALYGVETKVLVQAVRRNLDRLPKDFLFQLSPSEFANLRSQTVTSSWGGRRDVPYVYPRLWNSIEPPVAAMTSHQFDALTGATTLQNAFGRWSPGSVVHA